MIRSEPSLLIEESRGLWGVGVYAALSLCVHALDRSTRKEDGWWMLVS